MRFNPNAFQPHQQGAIAILNEHFLHIAVYTLRKENERPKAQHLRM